MGALLRKFVIYLRNNSQPMDFQLTEEHLMIQEAARDFARTELLPGVIERDNTQTFPTQAIAKMGELGYLSQFWCRMK